MDTAKVTQQNSGLAPVATCNTVSARMPSVKISHSRGQATTLRRPEADKDLGEEDFFWYGVQLYVIRAPRFPPISTVQLLCRGSRIHSMTPIPQMDEMQYRFDTKEFLFVPPLHSMLVDTPCLKLSVGFSVFYKHAYLTRLTRRCR